MVDANQNHDNMIKNTTSSDARLWTFRNKISIVEADQNHLKIIKKHYINWWQIMRIQKQDLDGGSWSKPHQNNETHYTKWCHIMIIQEQDLYGGGWSKPPQNNQKHYIKWCQIMSIQKQDRYGGS